MKWRLASRANEYAEPTRAAGRRTLGRSVVLAAALVSVSWLAVAMAAPDAASPAAPLAASDSVPPVTVAGFRSAVFGSDEKAVRAAIVKDFGLSEKAITKSENLADRTDILTVKVPDVIPGGGTADIAYTFGYKSKNLTQVSVIWSKGSDKTLTTERLLADGQALKAYFAAAGYDPKTVVADSAVHDGILLFRGADAAGHTTALMLHGAVSPDSDKSAQTFVPNALLLFYLADPKTPDVFRIQPGRF